MEKPIEQIPRNNPTKHNANSDLNIGEYVWKLPMVKLNTGEYVWKLYMVKI